MNGCPIQSWGKARRWLADACGFHRLKQGMLSPDTDGRVRRRDNGFPYQPREAKMLRDIDETFHTLRKINMKLNPKKCTFGEVEGMFLGFLSKSAETSLPLIKTLKKCIKKSDFHWTPEAEQAFKKLKQHLSELPLLVAPNPKEELIIYLSATQGAISAVLMTERGMVQTPVYFVNQRGRTITKIERHAGRTQYHLPSKDVGERTDPCGFPYREVGRKSVGHISG
ncbi:reverse transcriptase domain-containing protein [Tanacetum coccineum]